VDIARYPFRQRRHIKPRLFWMRSFHPVYNPEMAVRALASVQREFKDATLVIAGQDKGTQSAVRALAHDLKLDQNVFFPGYLDMPAKVQYGNTADIFINTNRIDNTPVAVIEACAMGLPVIATAVGGMPDLVTNEQTALLVPDNDHEAMADSVRQLLADPELVSRLSCNGRRMAEKFSWERVRPLWEGAFADAMVRTKRAQ
jgi:glycosyltransferase involved in cell wall biosynthesis